MLFSVDAQKVEKAIFAFQTHVRGKLPIQDMVAIDGKQPKHSQGQHILNAVSLPGQHYLGSANFTAKPPDENQKPFMSSPVAKTFMLKMTSMIRCL